LKVTNTFNLLHVMLLYMGIVQRRIPRFEATFSLKMEAAVFSSRAIHISRRACLLALEIGNTDSERYDRFSLKISNFVRNISALKIFTDLHACTPSRTLSVV
jgi:hypothetical protein